jgi:hypothetical protein
MSPEKRYSLFLDLAEWAWQSLDLGGKRMARRRWAAIRRSHDLANRRLVEKFREIE